MDDSSSGKKNWKLTPEAFDKLLLRLNADREAASIKYELLRNKLIRFFERRNCRDPEHLTNETIDRVCRRIMEGEVIEDITKYAYGVAKLVHLEELKRTINERDMFKNLPPPPEPDPDPEPDSELKMDCFKHCLNKLSDDDRNLIIRYYSEDNNKNIDNRKELAEEKGIQLNALRIRAYRIRKKLEKCIEKCIKGSSQSK